jgi:hypothetical protein
MRAELFWISLTILAASAAMGIVSWEDWIEGSFVGPLVENNFVFKFNRTKVKVTISLLVRG